MKVLVDAIRSETPRPKSPAMNNEEPIELSHYPAAKKPQPGVPVSDDEEENVETKNGEVDARLQREAEELEKLNSGIGSAIAKDLKETAKYRKWKQQNLDPRNASRTPSASKEPVYKLR
ncbi:hypothetical protein DOY81_015666 [Sarcophaga bullata]|nr:hypothetical protein DOY81_015666 [Sarcophaga bullata]